MSEFKHVIDQLSSYIDDQLPASERPGVEAHLRDCPSCRRRHQELMEVRTLLKSESKLTPPESFYTGVMARIEGKSRANAWFPWGFPAKALASACIVLLVVMVTRETRKESSNRVMDSAERIELRQPAMIPHEKDSQRPLRRELKVANTVPSSSQPELKGQLKKMIEEVPRNEPLAKRSDIRYQARDMQGMAAQNSFEEGEAASVRLKQKARASAPATLQSKSGRFVAGPNADQLMSASSAKPDLIYGVSAAAVPLSWNSIICGVKHPTTVVVKDAVEWSHLWNAYHRGEAPEVDFARFMVVGVYAGEMPSIGYTINIVSARETGGVFLVVYRNTLPAPGIVYGQVTTQPFHLLAVPRTSLPVEFKER